MSEAAALRAGAEDLAARVPALLAEAQHLAQTVILGDHGRRRPGQGDDFWQYRAAHPGDASRAIDWRRSARSDSTFVQDKEWQIAQTVVLWADLSASMTFASAPALPSKAARARLVTLALAVLLSRGGERVGLSGLRLPPQRGSAHLPRMAEILIDSEGADYGSPETQGMLPHSRAVFVSDFLGPLDGIEQALTRATDRGARGALLQVLDPAEEAFPFSGRTVFESMGGALRHETLQAADLRDRYLARLAERKDRLATLAAAAGWQFTTHHTDRPAAAALLWLHGAIGRR